MTIKTHGRMVTDNTVGIPQLAVTDGTSGQAIVTDGSGTMTFATVGAGGAVGSSVYIENLFTGDGTTTTFTLSTGAPYEESILTFIDGVAQPTTSFTLPSTTSITFSPAPGNGAAIRVVHLGIASSVADNSITGAKLSMGGDAAGDILYYNGTDYQKLGIGTTGQHLATNSAVNAPEWVTPPATFGTVGSGVVAKTQVVSLTDMFSPTGNYNVYTDITGLSGAITPSLTTSKVYLSGHVMLALQSRTMIIRIMRSIAGGAFAEVGSGTNGGTRIPAHSSAQTDAGSNGPHPASIHFVDTPTFTLGQAVTYKIQARDNAAAGSTKWYCNGGAADGDTTSFPRTISGFTIQELL
jgi:hypothetical protein